VKTWLNLGDFHADSHISCLMRLVRLVRTARNQNLRTVIKEFAAKNAICLKECREARFWLRVAEAKRLGNERMRKCLLQESNELVSIYVVIVRKLKNK
jgi:four helix bundle protein